jgi:predicted nucleic acid-binding protein
MPNVEAFLDTNVFLYAASSAPGEQKLARCALELIANTQFGTSIQVVQEFYVNATGKLKKVIPEEKVSVVVELLLGRPLVLTTLALFRVAVRLRERYQIGYYDAAIVAAARELGARVLYSQDLSHEQVYEGIRVVNPFYQLT